MTLLELLKAYDENQNSGTVNTMEHRLVIFVDGEHKIEYRFFGHNEWNYDYSFADEEHCRRFLENHSRR